MRIVIGEFKQETNTFVTSYTSRRQFEDFHLWYGDAMLDGLRDTNTEVAGFLDICDERGIEVVPTLAAFAISGGPLVSATYTTLRDELLQRIDAARPFDAVLLALHGAMVAVGEPDADGATLAAVRKLIGPHTPLVVSLDLHANVTARAATYADAIVGFRTSPHIDQRETGRRAARLLADWLAGTSRPTMAHVRIPMIAPASTHVHFLAGPFKRLMDAGQAIEEREALAASVFTVQPWLDVPDLGFATVVVTDGDQAAAARLAQQLAAQAWAERHAFLETQLVPPEEAIAAALAETVGPVVLSDLADGTAAGSPGDATAVIAALLAAAPDRPALVCVCDPEVAAEAQRIGVGRAIDTLVGGKRDNRYNRPVRFDGHVEFAAPASYRFTGQAYTGITMDMGLSAVLRCGQVFLLVTSNPVMTVDPALYRAVGLEPADAQIVVVKSHIQFRAGYAPIARKIILLDSPGMSSDHLTSLDFRHVGRPLFPLDDGFAPELVLTTCYSDEQKA
jgi:microcystin degradation protein MlrC